MQSAQFPNSMTGLTRYSVPSVEKNSTFSPSLTFRQFGRQSFFFSLISFFQTLLTFSSDFIVTHILQTYRTIDLTMTLYNAILNYIDNNSDLNSGIKL